MRPVNGLKWRLVSTELSKEEDSDKHKNKGTSESEIGTESARTVAWLFITRRAVRRSYPLVFSHLFVTHPLSCHHFSHWLILTSLFFRWSTVSLHPYSTVRKPIAMRQERLVMSVPMSLSLAKSPFRSSSSSNLGLCHVVLATVFFHFDISFSFYLYLSAISIFFLV